MFKRLSLTDDIVDDVRQLPSPNFSDRPADCDVDTLIIHNISLPPGEYGTGCVDRLFCNELDVEEHEYFAQLAGLRVSSHVLIERDGSLVQYVPFDKKAWHAGESCFEGREACNDFSIGVELEGTDFEPFTQQQYQSLVELTVGLMKRYPKLSVDRIVGHSDVAPGRKTDPGPHFDWAAYKGAIFSANNQLKK